MAGFIWPAVNTNPPAPAAGWNPHAVNTAQPKAGAWDPHAVGVVTTRPPCISESDATGYFATSPSNAAWQALTGDERTAALAMSCRWLGTLCWQADVDCCDRDFLEAWTMASAELALWLHQHPTAIIGGAQAAAQAGTYISKQQLGDLVQEFRAFPSSVDTPSVSSRVSEKAPLVLQRAPWLVDILGCWLQTNWKGTRRFVPLYRS